MCSTKPAEGMLVLRGLPAPAGAFIWECYVWLTTGSSLSDLAGNSGRVWTTSPLRRLPQCASSRENAAEGRYDWTRHFVNSSLNKESALTDRKLGDSDRITPWLVSLHQRGHHLGISQPDHHPTILEPSSSLHAVLSASARVTVPHQDFNKFLGAP